MNYFKRSTFSCKMSFNLSLFIVFFVFMFPFWSIYHWREKFRYWCSSENYSPYWHIWPCKMIINCEELLFYHTKIELNLFWSHLIKLFQSRIWSKVHLGEYLYHIVLYSWAWYYAWHQTHSPSLSSLLWIQKISDVFRYKEGLK